MRELDSWAQRRLGDLFSVKHGYAFPGAEFSEDPSFPTLLTPGNFEIGGGFKEAKPKTFTGAYPPQFELQADDLVLTMTDLSKAGDTLGAPALVPAGATYLHNQRIGLVEIREPGLVDRGFLNYALRSRDYHEYIVGTATGSTVRHTSPTKICDFVMPMPEYSEQRAIADVLGALDDKIAANRKLESVAVSLLEAKFDALGFDDGADEVTESVVTDYFDLNPSYPKPAEPEPVYVDMKKLPTSSMMISEWETRQSKGGVRFTNGDTLLARITPCLENRKTGYVDFLEDGQVAIGSTEYIVLRSKPGVPPELSFFLAISDRFRTFAIRHMIGTSGRQRLSAGDLQHYPVASVAQSAIDEWGAVAAPIVSGLVVARDETRVLANLRDTLLPRLMSGELRVRDAEQQDFRPGDRT